MSQSKTSKNILIIMSGSIAAYKVCTVISQLKQKGYTLQVVMTEAAQKFVGAATIEGLLGRAPITSMYQSGQVMDHIHLERWADLILVAPATANSINKMAAGLGDDLATTLFLAHDFKKPFLVTPAMNTKMYLHPTTQSSLDKLKKMGIEILETASGVLACGEVGYGRLLEPELIIQEIEQRLQTTTQSAGRSVQTVTPQRRKKVLITSGGTQEPIDDVRFITNHSTGKTAAYIADQLIESGFEITYLAAKSAAQPHLDCEKIYFTTFKDLDFQLNESLKKQYDMIIHAAAVSDYSLAESQAGKINSENETLTLTLKKNPKLIENMKKLNPTALLVGFKLTATQDSKLIENKITNLFEKAKCDFVVHNDWSSIASNTHRFNLLSGKDRKVFENLNLENLTIELAQILFQKESL